jgi:signal transduction histidine kinase
MNALQSAHAANITVSGILIEGIIELQVLDDGIGIEAGTYMDLNQLLAAKHYGLVTMYERATLIGASIQIDSTPGGGTQISLRWTSNRPVDPL